MASKNKHSISDLVSEQTIALNIDVKNWKEAVRISGEMLVKGGMVEERYVDAMIETVESLGPYIVIAPGVALPHARPEDGVIKPCMSVVILKDPVNFGNEYNDPVKLVVSFGTVDRRAHVKALCKLARIIGDSKKLKRLMDATETQEVKKIIGEPA